MTTYEASHGVPNGLGIQVVGKVPDSVSINGRAGGMSGDSILVQLFFCTIPSMKRFRNPFTRHNRNIVGESAIERKPPFINRNRFVRLKAGDLTTGMDAGVGSSRGDDRYVLLCDACERCFNGCLDGRLIWLPLPPRVSRAVIFDRQFDGVHDSSGGG